MILLSKLRTIPAQNKVRHANIIQIRRIHPITQGLQKNIWGAGVVLNVDISVWSDKLIRVR